jgi:hypothetical protein
MTTLTRRRLLQTISGVGLASALLTSGMAEATKVKSSTPEDVIVSWYGLVLELVRHTSDYSPPVASRSFAYLGVTIFECLASGPSGLVSLAGQLQNFKSVPQRQPDLVYAEATVLHAALCRAVEVYFSHTGPTGKRAVAAMDRALKAQLSKRTTADILERSLRFGEAVAEHVFTWSTGDGGHGVQNLGFPLDYTLPQGASAWVPTNTIQLQQKPLLPQWGNNRRFVRSEAKLCEAAAHPAYSEDPSSQFFAEAREVYDVSSNLTPEQIAIARFWSDDPMLSPTPPGHWISIGLHILAEQRADGARYVEVLALLGLTLADSFIACWQSKYRYNLLRPVTFIRKHIDPNWAPLLITPPFPEYPSGHSVQSGAAADVLSHQFGTSLAFEDNTHQKDGLAARRFASFSDAADEAALSRLYGGIHFRSAAINGLAQGRCIAAQTLSLKTHLS